MNISTLALVALINLGSNTYALDGQRSVIIKVVTDHVDFLVGADLVGRYNIAKEEAKPYLWPLRDASGNAVTRAWPMEKAAGPGSTDHVHQKSAWFCHGDVSAEGIEPARKIKGVEGTDFWSEAKGHGRIVCTRVEPPQEAGTWGRVATQNEWLTGDGKKILDETRVLYLYDFGKTRLFVFESDLRATSAAVTFGDTKEGSFGVRISDQLREAGGKGRIENADRKVGEKNCWGQLSSWCDCSGLIAGQAVGLAVLDDPTNPYPASWHCRGYGLLAANPFGRSRSGFPAMKGHTDLVRLAPGEHLRLRYGLLIHPGNAQEGKVAEYFDRFKEFKNRQP